MRRGVILALIAVVSACTSVTPHPEETATPEVSATESAATPTRTPSGTPTPIPSGKPTASVQATSQPTAAPPTQAAIYGGVAGWISDNVSLGSSAYVNETVVVTMSAIEGIFGFDPQTNPALSHVDEPLFGSQLAPESQEAIAAGLAGVAVEFVPDRLAVVDESAESHLGCRPYVGGLPIVHLSAPLPRRDAASVYYVAVNIDRGCEGQAYLLDLRGTESGYQVVNVVSQSDWIV